MLPRSMFVSGWITVLLAISTNCQAEDLPTDSPRVSPLVKIIQQIEPAVVALFTPVENGFGSGSGTIIHPDGFVLTNHHVLPKAGGYALLKDGKPLQFRVVGRLPEKDIAVVELV